MTKKVMSKVGPIRKVSLYLQIIGYDTNGSNGKSSGADVDFDNRR